MSEINCLVLLNNPEKEIVLNMDNEVTYVMFNDEVRKNLQIDLNEPIQYSYFDSDGDRVLFNTEEEFKEFLNHASTIGYMITIFAYAKPDVEAPPPSPSSSLSESQEESFESSNIIHHDEEEQEKPAEEQESEILPSNIDENDNKPVEEQKEKEVQPQFNIKYQLPLGRQFQRKIQPGGEYKVVCDHCDQEITNLRYKCLQCPDYDLCENCEELRCKQENNQIHPDDHIFAKIRHPIHRPVPFICVPGNSPIVCPRHGLRRIPVAPEHMRNKRENRNNNNVNNRDVKVNNKDIKNNNNNLTKEERAKAKRERRLGRKEEIKSFVEQRGEKIQELEDRIRILEQQFASLQGFQSPNLPLPQNENTNVYGETFDSQRKFWPFQC